MVSEIIQNWMDGLACDGEIGIVVMLPLKNVCVWDEYCTPMGSWVVRADVRQWLNEHRAQMRHSRDQAEKNAFVRFPPDQSSLATLFKLTFA